MRNGLLKGFVAACLAGVLALAGATAVKAVGFAGDGKLLQAGTQAPDFSLPSQSGTNVSLKNYKGKYVVLYFYPKDMTSGCTIEAHNFERDAAKYAALNSVVLGVSLDTVESHKTFCAKDGLNFKLLADPGHKVIDAYGVPVTDGQYAQRDTFLIGPDGKVLKVWQVKDVQQHSEDILAAIKEMKK